MGKPTNSKSGTAVGVSGMEVAPGARTPCPPSPWKPGSGPSGLPVATPKTPVFSNRPTCRNAGGFRLVLAPCWCIAGVLRGAAWGIGAVHPGGSCSLPWKLLPSQAGELAALFGRFCQLIPMQLSGYRGWKAHVCFPVFAGCLENPRNKEWKERGWECRLSSPVILKELALSLDLHRMAFDNLAGPLGGQDAQGWISGGQRSQRCLDSRLRQNRRLGLTWPYPVLPYEKQRRPSSLGSPHIKKRRLKT